MPVSVPVLGQSAVDQSKEERTVGRSPRQEREGLRGACHSGSSSSVKRLWTLDRLRQELSEKAEPILLHGTHTVAFCHGCQT